MVSIGFGRLFPTTLYVPVLLEIKEKVLKNIMTELKIPIEVT